MNTRIILLLAFMPLLLCAQEDNGTKKDSYFEWQYRTTRNGDAIFKLYDKGIFEVPREYMEMNQSSAIEPRAKWTQLHMDLAQLMKETIPNKIDPYNPKVAGLQIMFTVGENAEVIFFYVQNVNQSFFKEYPEAEEWIYQIVQYYKQKGFGEYISQKKLPKYMHLCGIDFRLLLICIKKANEK